MIVRKKKLVERYEEVDVVCNGCSEHMRVVPEDGDDEYTMTSRAYFREYISIDYRLGYYSKIFGDESRVQFELCERCLKKIVDGFVVPAEISR